MSETRIPEIIDALLTAFSTVTGADVVDGPQLSGDLSDAVYVGYDNDPDGTFASAASAQDWAGIGQRKRNEAVAVTCSLVCHSDDETVRGARGKCFALLTQCGVALRADPSLGLSSPCVAGMAPGEFFTYPDAQGMWGRLTFTVHVQTRV